MCLLGLHLFLLIFFNDAVHSHMAQCLLMGFLVDSDFQGCRKKRWDPNLRCYLGTGFEELSKTTKYPRISGVRAGVSNPRPSEYEAYVRHRLHAAQHIPVSAVAVTVGSQVFQCRHTIKSLD